MYNDIRVKEDSNNDPLNERDHSIRTVIASLIAALLIKR